MRECKARRFFYLVCNFKKWPLPVRRNTFDEARSKLAEIQVVLKSEAAEIAQLEGHSPIPGETPARVEDAVNRARADFEVSMDLGEQRQATADEAEQQLRTEREALKRLEARLDELLKNMGCFSGQFVPR